MADRVTPWDDNCTVSDRIDEIVATSANVHIEMLDEQNAFMQIGGDRFAAFVKKGRLYIAWRKSDLPPRSR